MGPEIGGIKEGKMESNEVVKRKRTIVPKGEHPQVHVKEHSSRRRSVALSGRDGLARYAKSVKEIEEGRQKIEKTTKEMLKKLGVEVREDKKPGMVGRWVNSHLPTRIVPKSVRETFDNWIHGEDPDLLEVLEEKSRENVNSLQSAVSSVVEAARLEKEDIEELEEDLAQAIEENWDARTLHEYMVAKSGVDLYAEIAEFLDNEFDLLEPEKREERKKFLLFNLQKNVQNKNELMNAHKAVCFVGLDLVQVAILNHYGFVNLQRPLAAIRDAAKSMGDTNVTMDSQSKAVKNMYEMSMNIIDSVYDATKALEQCSITSGNVDEMIAEKRKGLQAKIKEFENLRSSYIDSLPEPQVKKREEIAPPATQTEEV